MAKTPSKTEEQAQPDPDRGVVKIGYRSVAMALALLAGGGGLGTAVSTERSSAELVEVRSQIREVKAEIVGEIRRLGDRQATSAKRLSSLESRLADHVQKSEHQGAFLKIEELRRLLKKESDER